MSWLAELWYLSVIVVAAATLVVSLAVVAWALGVLRVDGSGDRDA